MDTQLKVTVVKTAEEAEQIASEWGALWERCPNATTFQRPEWIISWIDTFRPREPLILEIRENGELVGVAPFLIYEEGSQRIVGLMGGGVSDYLDILIEPDRREQTLSEIMGFITQSEIHWDVLSLTDLPAASPLLQFAGDSGLKPSHHDVCTELVLPSDAKHLKSVISKHKYENLRNARSRMQRIGEAHIELAMQATLNEFLDALFELHAMRWKEFGESGVLADPHIQAFHREVAPELLDRKVLRFYGLRLEGRLVATLYSFFEREAVYCYLQGFDPAYASLSAGTLLLGAVIEDSISESTKRVDFLRGQESYKYSWGVKDAPTYRIIAARQSLILNRLGGSAAA
jgi:CelD/BcsL family acetyltransferase involved in cellulose biosynthesis